MILWDFDLVVKSPLFAVSLPFFAKNNFKATAVLKAHFPFGDPAFTSCLTMLSDI
jgi:hypothetical protein